MLPIAWSASALFLEPRATAEQTSVKSSASLSPLPADLRSGLTAVSIFGLLSFVSAVVLLCILCYRLIVSRRSHLHRNQFFLLILNLLVANWIAALDGVTEVHPRETAVAKLELPGDRIGDLFVLSARDWVIGRTPEHHDLAKLEGTLRSHGGRYEEMVPFLISEPLNAKYAGLAKGDPRNFDIFDFACNGIQQ